MKNNLLKEIKNIKKLMGLNEATDQECVDQLEDANYAVISPTEINYRVDACIKKENIKCVTDWLNNEGIPNTYNNYNGLCYVQVVSQTTVKPGTQRIPDEFWLFWENYDVTRVTSFETPKDDAVLKKQMGQYQIKGKYKCDGNNLEYYDMRYYGSYPVDKYNTSDIEKTSDYNVEINGTTHKISSTVIDKETFTKDHFTY